MAFERVAEDRIRRAIAEGKLDNLPGAGEPLDLEEYFSAPEDLRVAYSILKNARCAPAEVELLNEIARLKDAVAGAAGEVKQSLLQTLARRQTELSILFERRARQERRPRHEP